ncbi:MAG: OmpA family protein [Desulfobacterium sp.]|nr:OmpA family protein [Desulfobacterium sp.]
MKKFTLKPILIVCMALLLAACAGRAPVKPLPAFQPKTFDAAKYKSGISNFLVLFDASSSMGEPCSGQTKFTIAKEFVDRMNQTIPELGQNAGLRAFGLDTGISKKSTVQTYGMVPYATAGLAAGLDGITGSGGPSPMDKALCAAGKDLDQVLTKTALIVVSDGKDMASKTVDYATMLKEKFGSALCIYPVLVGKDAQGMALMQELAVIGDCGFFSQAEDLLTGPAMADFVETVFLSKQIVRKKAKPVPVVTPMDKDNDGVLDGKDQCPDTPRGVSVDAWGCPFDSDQDGVYDYKDQCPGTPLAARVNALGCWILMDLLFDYDRAEIKSASFSELDHIVTILEKNPNLTVAIKGHTDSRGPKAYNKALSLRRADAVKQYLESKGISAQRLTAEGLGDAKPVASNKTDTGRAMNRRVELHPTE